MVGEGQLQLNNAFYSCMCMRVYAMHVGKVKMTFISRQLSKRRNEIGSSITSTMRFFGYPEPDLRLLHFATIVD